MQKQWILIVTLVSINLSLTGCATGGKDAILPQDGPTMKTVYERHFEQARLTIQQIRTALGKRVIHPDSNDLAGYTRHVENEIQSIFQRLPNPTLVMYIFPHLSGQQGNPVPGYSTSFPLYESVEYALPGEVYGFQ